MLCDETLWAWAEAQGMEERGTKTPKSCASEQILKKFSRPHSKGWNLNAAAKKTKASTTASTAWPMLPRPTSPSRPDMMSLRLSSTTWEVARPVARGNRRMYGPQSARARVRVFSV